MAYQFARLAPEYARLWASMTINPSRIQGFTVLARRLIGRMPRYDQITAATGVPKAVIAVIHEREGSGSFATYLGNGQVWNKRTTIVPVGRGPWASFEEAAIDALTFEGLHKITDWTIERALFVLESYNGMGYRSRNIPSPYLWSGTSVQRPGKFVRDGQFDPTVVDVQPGCAPLLCMMFGLDNALMLRLGGDPPRIVPDKYEETGPPPRLPDAEPPPDPPMTPSPVTTGIIGAIAAAFTAAALFGHQAWAWLTHLFN